MGECAEIALRSLAIDDPRTPPSSQRTSGRDNPGSHQAFPSQPLRKRGEDAQLALDDLDTMHAQAIRRLDQEYDALRARRDEERRSYEAQRDQALDRLEKARAKL